MSRIYRQGGVLVVRPKGALRADSVESLNEEITGETRGGVPLIAIDLSEVPLFDGAGLEWILDLDHRFGERGGSVRLCNVCDLCQDLLRITCVGERIDQFGSLGDALRSFSQ
jgi:anti-anti-sigma factor